MPAQPIPWLGSCTILTIPFTEGKLPLGCTCRGGQANTGDFNKAKYTCVYNLHKQKACAYKLSSPSIKVRYSQWVSWDGCQLRFLVCVWGLQGRYLYEEESQSFTQLNWPRFRSVTALLIKLELTVVNSGVWEQSLESQAFLNYSSSSSMKSLCSHCPSASVSSSVWLTGSLFQTHQQN